jgi:hypothetical protein
MAINGNDRFEPFSTAPSLLVQVLREKHFKLEPADGFEPTTC